LWQARHLRRRPPHAGYSGVDCKIFKSKVIEDIGSELTRVHIEQTMFIAPAMAL
jgi:hypothetical protein